MRDSDILRAGKELILTHHTTGTFARDAQGVGVHEMSPSACTFCSAGAVSRVMGKAYGTPLVRLEIAARRLFQQSVTLVNDYMGLEAVRKMFDAAIEDAEKAERRGELCAPATR